MHDPKSINSSISINNFLQNSHWLPLRDSLATLDDLSQIPPITELSDNAGMRLQGNDLMQLDDILQVIEQPQYLHLVVEKSLMDIPLYILHVDQLQSNNLSWVNKLIPLL